MSKTPWAEYQTAEPEPIVCWSRGLRWLYVGTGSDARSLRTCTLDQFYHELIWPGQRRTSYVELNLSRWTQLGKPRLELHPFAMLHLIASGQGPQHELLQAMRLKGWSTNQQQMQICLEVTSPCPLLDELEVGRIDLAFATNYNLERYVV